MKKLRRSMFHGGIMFYVITIVLVLMMGQGFAQDLSGIWYDYTPNTGNKGQVSEIIHNGNSLTFINHFGSRSKGRFLKNGRVIAEDWQGGLKATISDDGKRIEWDNGSVWQRSKRGAFDLSGTWYDYTPSTGNKGQVSEINQNGNKLTFVNHRGNGSKGRFLNDRRVIAEDWQGGLEATISDDGMRIEWGNGSVWQRSRR